MIRSIFDVGSGMKILRLPGDEVAAHYLIKVKPQNTRSEENFCWVVLEVEYSKTYPKTMPLKLVLTRDDSALEDSRDGRAVNEDDLKDIIREVKRYGEELIRERRLIVYEVILRV